MADIEIVEREPAVVVGIPVIGAFTDLGRLVPDAWRTLHDAVGDTGEELAEVSVDLGAGRYHETVGLLVDVDRAGAVPLPGAVGTLVPGGAWAQATHDGAQHTIAQTFGRLLDWIAEQGRRAGPTKLDVGYRLDGDREHHVLAVRLA